MFNGLNALVIGAGSGIGEAICKELARKGCNLCICDENETITEKIAQTCQDIGSSLNVFAKTFNLTDKEAINKNLLDVLDKFSNKVNVLINLQCDMAPGGFLDVSQASFEKILSINFLSVVQITRLILPYMIQSTKAFILNLSSVSGESSAISPALNAAFASSKAALTRFTESLYKESLTHFPHVIVKVALNSFLKSNFESKPSRLSGNYPHLKRKLIPGLTSLTADEVVTLSDGKVEEIFFQVCADGIRLPNERAAKYIITAMASSSFRILLGDEVFVADLVIRLFPELVHVEIFKRWGLQAWRIYAAIFEKYLAKTLGIVAYPATISLFLSWISLLLKKIVFKTKL